MPITTFSSREFNQDLGRAKKASACGPVIITDRGKPTHVLLSYTDYQHLTGKGRSLLEALNMPGMDGIEFDPPKLDIDLRIPDFEE